MKLPEGLRKFLGIKTEEELKKEQELKKKETPKDKARNFFSMLIFAFIGAMLIKTFILESSRVPTGSMESTVLVGDFVLVNKIIYGVSTPRNIPFTDIKLPFFTTPSIREPKAYDVVVFDWPGNKDELHPSEIWTYVKRCAGVPGDTIQIINKVLYVNGKAFPRPPNIQYIDFQTRPAGYVEPDIFPKGAQWNRDNYGPLVVPRKGDVIKLTRENVEQWRTIIDREFDRRVVNTSGKEITIDGKPATSYTLKEDYYFMIGDNRDNSLDCRYWGFVSRSRIIGKAEVVYFSWDRDIPFSQPVELIESIRLSRIAKLIK